MPCFYCILLNNGNSIFVVLLGSFLLFLGVLHCVRALLVGILRNAVFVGVCDNERFVNYQGKIFVQGCLFEFQCGVFFVGSVDSDYLVNGSLEFDIDLDGFAFVCMSLRSFNSSFSVGLISARDKKYAAVFIAPATCDLTKLYCKT